MDDRDKQQPVTDDSSKKEPVKLEFSLPQLLGSALAAATAAFLGSRLGTAGTIFGAALASIIGAVGGTLYAAGLDRTSRRVSTVIKRGWERVKGEDPSVELAGGDGVDLVLDHHDPGTMAPVPSGQVADDAALNAGRKAILKRVVVAALAVFALSLVAVTAIELVTGRSLSGGSGTTVTDVVRPPSRPSTAPVPTEEPTPTSTPESSASPGQEPTPTPTPTPTATPTQHTPGPEPTPTQSPLDQQPTAPEPSTGTPSDGSVEPTPGDAGTQG